MPQKEIASRKERRRRFNPRKWAQTYLKNDGGLPTEQKHHFTEEQYREYWKNHKVNCSRCGKYLYPALHDKKIFFRKYFQDYCWICYPIQNFVWFIEQQKEKLNSFYLDVADFFFRIAWYFQDKGKCK